MVIIQLILKDRTRDFYWIGRIPNVGERIKTSKGDYIVQDVEHLPVSYEDYRNYSDLPQLRAMANVTVADYNPGSF